MNGEVEGDGGEQEGRECRKGTKEEKARMEERNKEMEKRRTRRKRRKEIINDEEYGERIGEMEETNVQWSEGIYT